MFCPFFNITHERINACCQFIANRQKGESQNGGNCPKLCENCAFSQNMWVSGGKKCSFFGKFGVLCSLVTSVLRFDLLPYYRQIALCIFYESAIQKISANKGVTWNN